MNREDAKPGTPVLAVHGTQRMIRGRVRWVRSAFAAIVTSRGVLYHVHLRYVQRDWFPEEP